MNPVRNSNNKFCISDLSVNKLDKNISKVVRGYKFLVFLFFFACAPRVAIKKGFDITKYRTIYVADFTPFGDALHSSALVKDEFTRQLIKSGFSVTMDPKEAELLLTGTVTQFYPSKRYLIQKQDTKDKTVVVTYPPIEIGGTNVYTIGSAFGVEGGQIIVSNSTIGISAKLVEPKAKEVMWANSYSYEGLDIQTATESVVNYLVKTIIKTK